MHATDSAVLQRTAKFAVKNLEKRASVMPRHPCQGGVRVRGKERGAGKYPGELYKPH